MSLIYQWCEDRVLPHMRVGGKGRRGKILIEEADLDGVLASFKVGKKEPEPLPAPAPPVSYRHVKLS
ncbi:hypothetical protein FRUB_04040 [Fimbriiglobus ruber]|uniref:Uncharacterized protein n=1 Tax=Fimbriiglobus ruber TaxID=1908690 RepID=A0A225DKN1_9BACT|nr:hypothetical protein FRUB_04040 [Fimbriiglobus ruber]